MAPSLTLTSSGTLNIMAASLTLTTSVALNTRAASLTLTTSVALGQPANPWDEMVCINRAACRLFQGVVAEPCM